MPTALITGASSGLGAEFARQLAARGADLVLVARDRQALVDSAVKLRARFDVAVEVLVADLTSRRQLAAVERRVASTDRPVEILVNNAGFGMPLAFERNDIDDEVAHLRLHVEASMRLMHAALGPMLARGHGRIVNVASIAAFMPRSTYGAVKGWLVSFSRWANVRYGRRGVSVTAVCPGFVHTNFHERLGLPPGEEGIAPALWIDARTVVRDALRAVARGRAVCVPTLRYKLIAAVVRVLPASVSARLGDTGR
ncbi:MAG: SDR family NAD(P)-dependent oxidoreductase [Actinomycetota bacterium]|nr:SDR family NAD(P)-dependent oxidoreductase [Actinomycetota bacterium]